MRRKSLDARRLTNEELVNGLLLDKSRAYKYRTELSRRVLVLGCGGLYEFVGRNYQGSSGGEAPGPETLGATDGPDDELLNTYQVAAWSGVSVQWLEIGRSRGYGPEFEKLAGNLVRYRRGAIRAWLRAKQVSPEGSRLRAATARAQGRQSTSRS